MITLNCTSCQKTLEIDDAFAGGVCRCQYCGTIQTVPAKLKSPTKPGAAPKTLYQKKPRGPGEPGTGLEGLSDAVASSSGLARGALRGNPNRAARPEPPPPPPPPQKNLLPIFIAASAVLLLLVIILLILLLRR